MRLLLPVPAPKQWKYRLALFLLTIDGIIFRAELALLLAIQTLFLLLTKRVTVQNEILPAGIAGVAIGLAATISIDSFFWQHWPLWPELSAFSFNVMSGQSSVWGVQPWHFYFLNALPRLLLNPTTYFLAIPISLVYHPATGAASMCMLVPSLLFVAAYSLQSHKEWRFIVYVIPSLTASAALGAAYVWTRRTRSLLYQLLSLGMVLSTVASFLLSSLVLLPASAANYPGGRALSMLHRYHDTTTHTSEISPPSEEISVYLGNLACQTGVTRFIQSPTTSSAETVVWYYDKTENDTQKSAPSFWKQFDYALVEVDGEDEKRLISDDDDETAYEGVDLVYGFAGIKVVRPGVDVLDRGSGRSVEEDIAGALFSADGVEKWRHARKNIRRMFTRGWWLEIWMEPRVRIMRRVYDRE